MKSKVRLHGRLCVAALAVFIALACVILPPAQAEAAGTIAYGAATVNCSTLNIRSGPNMDASILSTVGENVIVVIIDRGDGEWYYINHNGTKGYCKSEYFKDVLTAENFNATGVVTGDDVFMRERPNTSATIFADYDTGVEMTVIGINNGWYKVRYDGYTGYMRSDFMDIVGSYTPSQSSRTSGGGSSGSTPTSTGNAIADYALQYVGYSYVYAGASPSNGFDCSGLVYYVYKQFGVTLTRNSAGQWRNDGTKVSKDDLIPGDLVFFSPRGSTVTHVGIYIGDDQFVHASGVNVGVIVSRLDSAYYLNAYHGAKRINN